MHPETNPALQQVALSDLQSPIGFLTAYVPEEIFHAASYTPVFLFHTPDDHGRTRAHLPSFTCWIARSALDQALASSGTPTELTAIALAHTCDTAQALTDLWRRNLPQIPLFHFGMPLRLDSRSARAYLLSELRSLRERIHARTGRSVLDEALHESILVYNRTRTLVRRLYARAADFTPSTLYALVRAAFETPKETYNDHLAGVLEQPPLGGQTGVRIVGDMLDLGERYFALDAPEDKDRNPLEALADRLLALVPTPTKHHPQRSRAAHLLSLTDERRADGVIFARQKSCEPHGFDYVQLAQALNQASIPHLLVELEQGSQAAQLSTRVEAFIEMMTL